MRTGRQNINGIVCLVYLPVSAVLQMPNILIFKWSVYKCFKRWRCGVVVACVECVEMPSVD